MSASDTPPAPSGVETLRPLDVETLDRVLMQMRLRRDQGFTLADFLDELGQIRFGIADALAVAAREPQGFTRELGKWARFMDGLATGAECPVPLTEDERLEMLTMVVRQTANQYLSWPECLRIAKAMLRAYAALLPPVDPTARDEAYRSGDR